MLPPGPYKFDLQVDDAGATLTLDGGGNGRASRRTTIDAVGRTALALAALAWGLESNRAAARAQGGR
jgi:hypothetical protein